MHVCFFFLRHVQIGSENKQSQIDQMNNTIACCQHLISTNTENDQNEREKEIENKHTHAQAQHCNEA